MKTRRFLLTLLTLIIAVSLCLTLSACGGGGGDEGGEEGGGGDTPTGLSLVEGGNPTFQFVISKDAPQAAATLANTTFKSINKVLTKEAKIVNESASNAKDVEIIVGAPSFRGDEYKIDYHYLGPEGYAVKVVGTKIIILYGSEAAISPALTYVKETVFGITSKTKKLTEVVASEDKLIENKQEFTLKSATVSGNDLSTYVLSYPTALRTEAQAIQNQLYTKVGIWLPKGNATNKQKAVIIREVELDGDDSTPKGFRVYVDENQNLVIETEFTNKLADGMTAFFGETFFASGKKEVSFASDYVYSGFDARNIYYSDFGAKGNGKTNDFEAIMACHEYANEYGHTVNASEKANYYIGRTGGKSITVKTDTNWHGCTFTFDDTVYNMCLDSSCGGTRECEDCRERTTSIFKLKYDRAEVSVADVFKAHIATHGALHGGYGESDNTTKIDNWTLGYDALVYFASDERKIWIRAGLNADDGDEMGEVILVHADGTIDPTTPLSWDYTTVSWAIAYPANDKPITIDGGGAFIYNIANEPTDSEYISSNRNISISRSNVTVTGINHRLVETHNERGPYAGIISVSRANNVTFKDITLDMHKGRWGNNGAQQGSYEIGGIASNDLKYFNVNVIDFFTSGEDDDDYKNAGGDTYGVGEVNIRGLMGTNYCRNFHFDGCRLNSFDAHKGLGNLLIENCEFQHIMIMGSGDITIRNTTSYADTSLSFMEMRADYGASYRGSLTLDNCTLKIRNTVSYNTMQSNSLVILESSYKPNFDFDRDINPSYDPTDPDSVKYLEGSGSTNWLPEKIVIKDFKVVEYEMLEYIADRGDGRNDITERESVINTTVYLFDVNLTEGYTKSDISKFKSDGGHSDLNRYVGTKEIIVESTDGSDINFFLVIPNSPTFKDSTYTVNGKEQPWYTGS